MTTVQEKETSKVETVCVSAVWLWTVRIIAALNVLLVSLPVAYSVYAAYVPCRFCQTNWLTAPCVATLPFCVVLWRLRKDDRIKLADGLRLAMSWSVLVLIGLFILRQDCDSAPGTLDSPAVLVGFIVAAALNFALLVSAIVFYVALRERFGRRRMAPRYRFEVIGYACVTIVVWFLGTPGLHSYPRWPAHQAVAVSAIRTISTVQEQFRVRFPDKGYARSLSELREEGYIDSVLASGTRNHYQYTLTAGVDKEGRATSYTFHARPTEYASSAGCCSYWLSDAGVIRWTGEDRPATRDDPPID